MTQDSQDRHPSRRAFRTITQVFARLCDSLRAFAHIHLCRQWRKRNCGRRRQRAQTDDRDNPPVNQRLIRQNRPASAGSCTMHDVSGRRKTRPSGFAQFAPFCGGRKIDKIATILDIERSYAVQTQLQSGNANSRARPTRPPGTISFTCVRAIGRRFDFRARAVRISRHFIDRLPVKGNKYACQRTV